MTSKLPAFALFFLLVTSCAPLPPTDAVISPPTAVISNTAVSRPPSAVNIPPCTQIGQETVSRIDRAALLCVPAGEFIMGAGDTDTRARPHEKPAHTVNLDAFWIDRTEVTNRMFAVCVSKGGCDPRPAARGTTGVASIKRMNYYYDDEFANYPVLIYEAQDAADYCEWAGRRLPTEAEWEKAARGMDGRIFPWGSSLECTKASFNGCTGDTTSVDLPEAGRSPYGALNMAGNVWEWVSDQYAPDYYAHSAAANPVGPLDGEGNVRRGGGWRSLMRDLRATARASGKAHHYFDGQMGFRCAMSDREN